MSSAVELPDRIPALTVHEPWASAIIFGAKSPENRGWQPVWQGKPYRGPLWIHAGKRVDWDAPDFAWHAAGMAAPPRRRRFNRAAWTGSLNLGCVLGLANLDDCHLGGCDCSEWAVPDSLWHWDLSGPVPLLRPVPCDGHQKLWLLPGDVESAVRAQLEAK